jgi:hypothetical protein
MPTSWSAAGRFARAVLEEDSSQLTLADARAHKIVPSARDLLPQDDELAGLLAQIRSRTDQLSASADLAVAAFADAGIDAALLRGAAIASFYPPCGRQFNDIDMVIRRISQFTAALRLLRSLGWVMTRPAVARRGRDGWWAAAGMQHASDGLSEPLYLDLAVPGPGLGPHRHTQLMWSHIGPARQVPGTASPHLLGVLATELYEREQLIARDVLDVVYLLRSGADVHAAAGQLQDQAGSRGIVWLASALVAAGLEQEARAVGALVRASGAVTVRAPKAAVRHSRLIRRATLPTITARATVRRALTSGSPVYLFPDPDGRLPGLPGSSITNGLEGLTARAASRARSAEIDYSLSRPLTVTRVP